MLSILTVDDDYRSDSKLLSVVGVNTPKKDNSPLLQCTRHMCPVRVHWHVKQNYKDYWRSKVAITNFNYRMNYTQWTLVVQHPNLNNVTQVFSFNYKPLVPYESISKWCLRNPLSVFVSPKVNKIVDQTNMWHCLYSGKYTHLRTTSILRTNYS